MAAVVHEGLDLRRYAFGGRSGQHLAFVGILAEHKGCHVAIDVALRTRRRLYVIGRPAFHDGDRPYRERQRRYYETQIMPFVDNDRVVLLGELGESRHKYVRTAAALLSPIQWEEPFGRAVLEAQASGTPVIAFARGALPEVVEHGTTGFLVRDTDEMIDAIEQAPQLSRWACRERVADRFSIERVALQYHALYASLL